MAVVAVNNGEEPRTITCDGACFAQSNFSATDKLLVRDLWQHKPLGLFAEEFCMDVKGHDTALLHVDSKSCRPTPRTPPPKTPALSTTPVAPFLIDLYLEPFS